MGKRRQDSGDGSPAAPKDDINRRIPFARCTSCGEEFFGQTAGAQAGLHRFRSHRGEPKMYVEDVFRDDPGPNPIPFEAFLTAAKVLGYL